MMLLGDFSESERIAVPDLFDSTLGRPGKQEMCVVWPDKSKRYVELAKVHPFTGPWFYIVRANGPELKQPFLVTFPRYEEKAAKLYATKVIIVICAWHCQNYSGTDVQMAKEARDLFHGKSVRGLGNGG